MYERLRANLDAALEEIETKLRELQAQRTQLGEQISKAPADADIRSLLGAFTVVVQQMDKLEELASLNRGQIPD